MDDRDELKRALRERMKAARRALSEPEVDQLGRRAAERILGLPEVQRSHLVLCYVSFRAELPTRTLLQALLDAGKPVAVPRVEGPELRAHLVTHLERLQSGAYGVPTSDGPDVSSDVDVCITPGLAFTEAGGRLGYGGGYYDRFLGAHPAVFPVGLCYDLQVVPHLPMHAHDVSMAVVVTPARAIRVG